MNLSVYISTFIATTSFMLFSRRFVSRVLLAISCHHLEGIPPASVPTVEKSVLNGVVGMSLAVRRLRLLRISDRFHPGCEREVMLAMWPKKKKKTNLDCELRLLTSLSPVMLGI